MGKGNLKFGGKSGYLPKPRPIFKTSIFPTKKHDSPNTGYADGIDHPKGIKREQPPPKYVPLSKRIELTALAPKKQFSAEEFAQLPILQQIRIQNSELRRQYLKESYIKEAKRLEAENLSKEEQKLETARLKVEKAEANQDSEAFKLTIPSIEQYLNGPIMRQRTPEEKLLLQQKRTANRMNYELLQKSKKAASLLELYNSASSFITTEEKLNQAIIDAFDKTTDQFYVDNFSTLDESMAKNLETQIKNTLLGSNGNTGPGLNEVLDVLNGEDDKLMEIALRNAELMNAENKVKSGNIVADGEKDILDRL